MPYDRAMFKVSLIISLLLFSFQALSKVNNYPDKLAHVNISFEVPDYEFNFMDGTTEAVIGYKPSLHGLTTPGVSYKGLGASWGFKVGISEEDKVKFGETKYEDWRFNYAFSSFMMGVHYSQYTGFYIDNSTTIDNTLTENDPRIQLPDMYVRTIGGYFTWIWDKESFSMPGVADQTERQVGSGGSWLFGGAVSETVFNNSSGLIPASQNTQFAGANGLNEGKFLSLVAKGGYGYTLGDKWFLGGVIQLGLGLQYRRLSFQGGASTKGWDPAWRGEAQIAGGYNGDQFYTGLRVYSFGNIYNGAGMQIESTQINSSIFFGLHI